MANKPNNNDSVKKTDGKPKQRMPALSPQRTAEQQFRQEQEHRLELKKRLRNRRFKRFFLGILLLGLLGGLYYLLLGSGGKKENDRQTTVEAGALDDLETALKNGNVVDLMRLAALTQDDFMNQPLPIQIKSLKEKKKICERLEELNADGTSRVYGISGQLDALIMLDTLNCLHKLNDNEVRSEFVDLATRAIEVDDHRLNRKAYMGMCLAKAHDYSFDPTDGNLQYVFEQVDSCRELMRSDVTAANSLFKLGQLIQVANNENHIRLYKEFVGNLFKESDNAEIKELGAFAHDAMLVGAFDFEQVSEELFTDSASGIQKLDEAMKNVTANPRISSVPFSKLLSLTENLSQVNEDQLETKYVDDLRRIMKLQTDSLIKERMESVLERYDTRKALRSNKFELDGTTVEGASLNELCQDKVVIITFFSMHNETSYNYLEKSQLLRFNDSSAVKYLAYCVEQNVPNSKFSALKKKFSRLEVATRKSAESIGVQCPVAKVPYILILDKRHQVVTVNAHAEGVEGIVNTILDSQ